MQKHERGNQNHFPRKSNLPQQKLLAVPVQFADALESLSAVFDKEPEFIHDILDNVFTYWAMGKDREELSDSEAQNTMLVSQYLHKMVRFMNLIESAELQKQ